MRVKRRDPRPGRRAERLVERGGEVRERRLDEADLASRRTPDDPGQLRPRQRGRGADVEDASLDTLRPQRRRDEIAEVRCDTQLIRTPGAIG